MLEIDFARFADGTDGGAALRSIIAAAGDIAAHSNRDAVDFLSGKVGLRSLATRNEDYYRLAYHYDVALAQAYLDEPQAAIENIDKSGILPFDGGDLIFSEAQHRSLEIAAQQDESIAKHVPTVFMSAMPRAASAALVSTISALFQCPIVRASVGRFPHYYLVPFWVRRLSRGGCVLHDHFGADQFNGTVLSECGIRTVFLMIRDPRASAASYVQHVHRALGTPVTEDAIRHAFEMLYIPWLRRWRDYGATSQEVNVIWLRSADVTASAASLRSTIEKIIENLEPSWPGWQRPDLSTLSLADVNFVSGDPNSWRRFVSKPIQAEMWAKVPAETRAMLGLEA